MGRPTIGKRPMTPAERQRRRRKQLKSERSKQDRQAKVEARRAKSPYVTLPHAVLRIDPDVDFTPQPFMPPTKAELADEIVSQILEAIQLNGLTLADIEATMMRRRA